MAFIKCSVCSRDHYPNQLEPVLGYRFCPDCIGSLSERLSDRDFLAGLVRTTMTLGEVNRMRRESARAYAGSEVEVGQCI